MHVHTLEGIAVFFTRILTKAQFISAPAGYPFPVIRPPARLLCRCASRRLRSQPNVREYPFNRRRFFNYGNDVQLAATRA